MEHKIYMNYIHPSSLLRQLSDLWKADQMCDAVLTVDKIIVAKAHKVVLLAISPKLKSDSSVSSQNPILDVCLPAGISHRAVHAFLQYIYEGYLILTEKIAIQLRKIAEILQVKCLSNCCSDYLESLAKNENVIVLDEEVPEVKTEEFTHVRTSAVEDILKKRQIEDENAPSPSKRKKHSEKKENIPSPVPTSQQSPRPSQASFRAPDVSPQRGHQPSPQKTDSHFQTGGEMPDLTSIEIKTELPESCITESEDNRWNMDSSSQMLDPNSLSLSSAANIDMTKIKEEAPDDVDSTYFDSSQDTSCDMWISGPMDSSQQFSEAASESTISGSMAGPSHMSVAQKSMTPFSSLSQMRAQQSIKRSIQSSVSAARRARDMEQAQEQASTSSEDHAMQGDQDGSESQEKSDLYWCEKCGRKYKNRKTYQGHFFRFHRPHQHFCEICGHTFAFHRDYRQHRLTHDSQKPFPCSLCGKEYTTKKSLQSHQLVHHDLR